jgi:hypothetical protein
MTIQFDGNKLVHINECTILIEGTSFVQDPLSQSTYFPDYVRWSWHRTPKGNIIKVQEKLENSDYHKKNYNKIEMSVQKFSSSELLDIYRVLNGSNIHYNYAGQHMIQHKKVEDLFEIEEY